MNASFTARGDWFVFSESTGKTLKTGFPNKARAIAWIALQQSGGAE